MMERMRIRRNSHTLELRGARRIYARFGELTSDESIVTSRTTLLFACADTANNGF